MARAPLRTAVDLPWGLGSAHIPEVAHPGLAESLIPVWGPGKTAIADFQEGDVIGGMINAGSAALDIVPGVGVFKAVERGNRLYQAIQKGNRLYQIPRSTKWADVRKRGVTRGYWAKEQPVHHAGIPQGGWGKQWPDWMKNHPLNLTPMPSHEVHRRVHAKSSGSIFDPITKTWIGSPDWLKATMGSAAVRAAAVSGSGKDQRR